LTQGFCSSFGGGERLPWLGGGAGGCRWSTGQPCKAVGNRAETAVTVANRGEQHGRCDDSCSEAGDSS